MAYPSIQVANRFIEVAKSDNSPLNSITELIKLIYIAHGWHLAACNKPLIDEKVVAWKYGPAIIKVYNAFKDQLGTDLEIKPTHPSEIDSALADRIINSVFQKYKGFGYKELTRLTHEPGTPWDVVTDEKSIGYDVEIPNELIRTYYRRIAAASRTKVAATA